MGVDKAREIQTVAADRVELYPFAALDHKRRRGHAAGNHGGCQAPSHQLVDDQPDPVNMAGAEQMLHVEENQTGVSERLVTANR